MSSRNNANSPNNVNRISLSKESSIFSYTDRDTTEDAFVGVPDDISRTTSLPDPGQIITDGMLLYFDGIIPNAFRSGNYSLNSSGLVWRSNTDISWDFVMVNGLLTDTDGRGCLLFDGVDDYCRLGSGTIAAEAAVNYNGLIGRSGTISHWVKDAAVNKRAHIFYASSGSSNAMNGFGGSHPPLSIEMHTASNFNGGHFFIYERGDTTISGITQNYAVSMDYSAKFDNEWYDYTVTWNEEDYIRTYINGVLVSQNLMSGVYTSTIPNNIFLGIDEYSVAHSSDGREWNGKIANVYVYDRPLNASEVLHNYNVNRYRFTQNQKL